MSSRRFHVGRDGNPKECTAEPGKCPLGGEHYDSMEKCYAAIEKNNTEDNADGKVLKKVKTKTPSKRSEKIYLYDDGKHISLAPGDYAILTVDEPKGLDGPKGLNLVVSESQLPSNTLDDADTKEFLGGLSRRDTSDGVKEIMSKRAEDAFKYAWLADRNNTTPILSYSECSQLYDRYGVSYSNPIIHVKSRVSAEDDDNKSESAVEFYIVSRGQLERNGLDVSKIDFRHFDKTTKIFMPIGVDGEDDYSRGYDVVRGEDVVDREKRLSKWKNRRREEEARKLKEYEEDEPLVTQAIEDQIEILRSVDSTDPKDYLSALVKANDIERQTRSRLHDRNLYSSMSNEKKAYEDAYSHAYDILKNNLVKKPFDSIDMTGAIKEDDRLRSALNNMFNKDPELLRHVSPDTRSELLTNHYYWANDESIIIMIEAGVSNEAFNRSLNIDGGMYKRASGDQYLYKLIDAIHKHNYTINDYNKRSWSYTLFRYGLRD